VASPVGSPAVAGRRRGVEGPLSGSEQVRMSDRAAVSGSCSGHPLHQAPGHPGASLHGAQPRGGRGGAACGCRPACGAGGCTLRRGSRHTGAAHAAIPWQRRRSDSVLQRAAQAARWVLCLALRGLRARRNLATSQALRSCCDDLSKMNPCPSAALLPQVPSGCPMWGARRIRTCTT
jgi:hypothetical protein